MYTCVLGAIIKNEHHYLAEWIEYHLSIGIEHIYLYEDIGTISHSEITKNYKDKVTLVSLEDDRFSFLHKIGYLKQASVYNIMLLEYKDKYDYIGFLDIDEFLTFEPGFTLQDLIEENKDNRAFLIQWKVMSANKLIERPEKVLDSYTQDISNIYEFGNLPSKSFINLHKIVALENCHAPTVVDKQYSYIKGDKVYVTHYYTKSWDDWCDRFLIRGDLIPDNRHIIDFFRSNPDMLPIKQDLLERFFNKCNSIRDDITFVHIFSHTPLTQGYYRDISYNDMLAYDVLCYSLSFTYLKRMGKKIKLYTTSEGSHYLEHLNYDEVIIIPDSNDCCNGLRCLPTLYALQNEPLSSVFVHGDCFLKDPIVLGFLEYVKSDIIVLQEQTITPEYVWSFFVNALDVSSTYLTPDIVYNKDSFDVGILKFNNQKLKNDFIAEVLNSIPLYQNSLTHKFWDNSRSFLPDRGIYSFILHKLVKEGNYTYEEMGGVKLNYYKRERMKEKIKFMGILHLTQISRFNDSILPRIHNLFQKTDSELYTKTCGHIENIKKERN